MNAIGSHIVAGYLDALIEKGAARPFFGQFPNTDGQTIAANSTTTFTPVRTTNSWLLFTDFQLAVTAADMTQVRFTVQVDGNPFAPFVTLMLPPNNAATALPGASSGIFNDTPMIFSPNAQPSFKIDNNFDAPAVVWLMVWGYFWDGKYNIPELRNLFYGDPVNGI